MYSRGRTTYRAKRPRTVSSSTKSRTRSASSIVRAPARRPGGYLWGPNNYFSQFRDPFPSVGKYVLRYSENFILNPDAGGQYIYNFSATSINDPNQTGVGHQPYGHDTLASIYNHYNVEKAVCTVVPTDFSTVGVYGMRVEDNASTSFALDTVREMKGTTMAVTTVGATPTPISRTYIRKKIFPVDKDTSGVFGNNPSENSFFQLFYQGYHDSVDPGPMGFIVNITYYVTCYELKTLAGS